MACIGLSALPGLGPRTIRRWIERAGAAGVVWQHLPAFVEGRAGQQEILAAWRTLDPAAIIARARRKGMMVMSWSDPGYPAALRTIADPPPVLFVRGTIDDAPAVAIVGSRRATPYGRAAAAHLAFALGQMGITVTSGLARGIDGAAHQAALDAGGRTVGVLGCGADVVYPREHRRLAEAMAGSGALITEFAPGTPPLPGHFPRRNRLISGLSLGVVVVEGAEDSGAMVTVDYALEQGREVFAVPGSIFSPRSRAPHALLRQGARLVENVEDILEELGLAGHVTRGPHPAGALDQAAGERATGDRAAGNRTDGDGQRVLAALGRGPASLDDLVDDTGLPASRLASVVTMLELRGLIRTLPGQMVMQTPQPAEAMAPDDVAQHDVARHDALRKETGSA